MTRPSDEADAPGRLPKLLVLIALGLLLWYLAGALLQHARLAAAALAFPFPLDYAEGPLLDQVVRLAHFENIYRNSFAAAPYTLTNNPPLFHLVQAPLVWSTGPALWYGRLVSLLSAVAAAGMIGLILRATTGDWLASAIGGLAFLSFPYVLQVSVLDRADMLGLALSLAGLYAVVHRPASRRGVLAAGLLLVAAAFTQPGSALAALAASLLWLWQRRQPRQAAALAAWAAASVLGPLAVINGLTRGGFLLNLVSANLPGFSWYPIIGVGVELYLHAGYLVIAFFCFLIVERLSERTASSPLLTAYLGGAGLATMLVGLTASGPRFALEAVTTLSLAAGVLVAWTGENHWLKALVIFVLALQVSELARWSREDFIPPFVEKIASYRDIAELAALIRETPGTVLADEYMGLLPLAGRRLYFQPLEYRRLQEAGLWSQDDLIASIQQQEFPAILLYEPTSGPGVSVRWTPELRNAIYAQYLTAKTLARNIIYRPKPASQPGDTQDQPMVLDPRRGDWNLALELAPGQSSAHR